MADTSRDGASMTTMPTIRPKLMKEGNLFLIGGFLPFGASWSENWILLPQLFIKQFSCRPGINQDAPNTAKNRIGTRAQADRKDRRVALCHNRVLANVPVFHHLPFCACPRRRAPSASPCVLVCGCTRSPASAAPRLNCFSTPSSSSSERLRKCAKTTDHWTPPLRTR